MKKSKPKRIDMHFQDPPGCLPGNTPCDASPPARLVPAEYVMGLAPQLSTYDLQAAYRDAFMRVHFARRFLGIAETVESREADRKLKGTLEIVVLPGARAVMLGQPQVKFQPSRVVIDDEASDWYNVSDIKVGKNSQLVSTGAMPGSAFKSTVSQDLKMDEAQISVFIAVELVNVSGKPRRFPRMMMFGRYAKESL